MANLKSTTVADGTIELPDHSSAPSPTANKLYANTTSLYWEDGDLVSGGGGGAADKQTTGNAISNSSASDSGATQGYRMQPGSSTTFGITAKANTFMHGTFYNELVVMGDVEAPGLYIRGEGTDNNQSITEQGPTAHTLTVANQTKYENTVALPWATTSIYFDGTGDKITAAQHSDFQMLEDGDYTVELWVQHSDHAGTEVYIEFYEDASNFWQLQHVHGTGLQFSASTAVISNFSMTGTEIADTLWHHVAVVKTGIVYYMYFDGALVASVDGGSDTTIMDTLAGTLQIGDSGAGSEGFQGYMAEIRLTKGMARYTENFVPPQGYLSARMASFAIDATTFNSTDTPGTLDVGARDRLGEDTLGDGHVQVTFKENYTINSTAYMIPVEFKNTSDHEWSLNTTIWSRAISNTYMLASDSVATFAASAYYGNRGVWAGGYSGPPAPPAGYKNVIDYVAINSAGNATDFGDLNNSVAFPAGASNGSRGLFAGGEPPTGTPALINVIDYITFASTGNATDFGDTTVAAGYRSFGSCGDGSRGVFAAGQTTPTNVNVIEYVTISVTGNGKDFGDLSFLNNREGSTSNGSRGVFTNGRLSTTNYNNIEYITIGTIGNSIDFGDQTSLRYGQSSVSDGSRAVTAGGTSPAPAALVLIDYFNIASLGNAIDFVGELTSARTGTGSVSNGSRGVWGAGDDGADNVLDYIPIGVAGTEAVDFGDASVARSHSVGISGD